MTQRVDLSYRVRALVGRDQELATLDAVLRDPLERTRVVEVVGDPGIGKTRLLDEFAARARNAGVRVLCCPSPIDGPQQRRQFGPLIDAIDDHAAATGDPVISDMVVRLHRLLPPEGSGHEAQQALRTILTRLVGPAGLLLLDGAHQADPATCQLIDSLLRRPPQARLTIVVAYRPRQAGTALLASLAHQEARGTLRRMRLEPLTRTEVDQLLTDQIEPARRHALYRHSSGNPGYLEALVPGCSDEATRGQGGDTGSRLDWPLEPHAAAVLFADFQALPPNARLVANAASVLEDPFDPELLASVADLSDAQTLDGIDELLSHDLLRTTEECRRFHYRHPLLRQVAYQMARVGWVLGAHRRARLALTARRATPSVLAPHIERTAPCGDQEAISILVEAGRSAPADCPERSARWLRTALRLLPDEQDSGHRQAAIRLELASALLRAGEAEDARSIWNGLLGTPEKLSAGQQRAAVLGQATADRVTGRYAAAAAGLRTELDHDPLDTELVTLLAAVVLESGEDAAVTVTAAGRETDGSADPAVRAYGRSLRAAQAVAVGEFAAAAPLTDSVAEFVDNASDRALTARLDLLLWLGRTELGIERYAQARQHLTRATDLAAATGQRHILAQLIPLLGTVHLHNGQLAEARALLDGMEGSASPARTAPVRRAVLSLRSQIACARRETDEALSAADEAAALPVVDTWLLPPTWLLRAQAQLAADDPEAAAATINLASGPQLSGTPLLWQVPACVTALRAELRQGNHAAATDWTLAASVAARRSGRRGDDGMAMTAVALTAVACRSTLAAEAAEAAQNATTAATMLTALGRPVDAAWAEVVRGVSLAAGGQDAAAGRAYETALRRLTQCHVSGFAADVHTLIAGREQPAGELSTLSEREAEIAELVSLGHTNRQIARSLSISQKTVETYLARIFAKLEVSSRAAVAALVGRAVRPGVRLRELRLNARRAAQPVH